MKKVIFTLSLLVATSANFKAQTPPPTVAPVSNSLAEITFDKETHDFGTVEYAGNGTFEFKFKNTGKEPLIITDAKGSCGCTVPTYPKNTPIKPGETQVIKVTYDTKRAGGFNKTVTVTSNAQTPTKTLTIKGKVDPAPVEEAFPSNGKKDDGATPLEKH